MAARSGNRTTSAATRDDPVAAVTETLRRRAERLALPVAEIAEEADTRVLTFSRGGRLAVAVGQVREVSAVHRIEPVPDQPDFVAGLVAWRGRPILAIEPAALLGAAPATAPTHQIVLGLSRGEIALLADEIHGVIGVPVPALGNVPAGTVGMERLAVGFLPSIGLLIDAGLLEASLLDHLSQSQEVRP